MDTPVGPPEAAPAAGNNLCFPAMDMPSTNFELPYLRVFQINGNDYTVIPIE